MTTEETKPEAKRRDKPKYVYLRDRMEGPGWFLLRLPQTLQFLIAVVSICGTAYGSYLLLIR